MIGVELWGGPEDGRVMQLAHFQSYVKIPVAPDLPSMLREYATPPDITYRCLRYEATRFRNRRGLYVYRLVREPLQEV